MEWPKWGAVMLRIPGRDGGWEGGRSCALGWSVPPPRQWIGIQVPKGELGFYDMYCCYPKNGNPRETIADIQPCSTNHGYRLGYLNQWGLFPSLGVVCQSQTLTRRENDCILKAEELQSRSRDLMESTLKVAKFKHVRLNTQCFINSAFMGVPAQVYILLFFSIRFKHLPLSCLFNFLLTPFLSHQCILRGQEKQV